MKLDATLHNCADALDKQSEAIKNLEHALDVTEKQRDEFLKDIESDVVRIKNQQAVIDMLQSEYRREHSAPILGVPNGCCSDPGFYPAGTCICAQ
jgi:hypothetical protein